MDLFAYQLELIKQEMDMLQSSIRGYDSILFTIKGWAITLFSGISLFAIDKQNPALYLFCIVSVLAFWLIDAFYKSTQNFLIGRYRRIEELLRSSEFEDMMRNRDFATFPVPYFQDGWFNTSKPRRSRLVLEAALQGHTFVLYTFLLMLALGLLIGIR